MRAGEKVLVLGNTGGIGLAAIQLAKAMYARVLAAVSSLDKARLIREARTDKIVNLAWDNLGDGLREQVHAHNGGKGADVVIDSTGGGPFDAVIRTLSWRGWMVVNTASGPPTLWRSACGRSHGMRPANSSWPPTVAYPFAKFAPALQDIQDRRGRVVLVANS